MDNFVLGTVLFLVYFSAISWLFLTPQSEAIASENEQVVEVEPATEQEELLEVSKQIKETDSAIRIDGNDWNIEERIAISSNPAIIDDLLYCLESNSFDGLWTESNIKFLRSLLPPTPVLEPSPDELLGGVEVENITLRQARKIAKRLGIKQTVTNNGKKKDKPLDWLQREIRQKLQQSPNEVAPVIKEEVLAA